MADAVITVSANDLASETLAKIGVNVGTLGDKLNATGGTGATFKKAIDDLIPSTNNAGQAFTDMKGIVADLFDNPVNAVKTLSGGVAQDLIPALGGIAVPAAVAGGALAAVGLAIFGLTEHAAEVGGSLNDMAEKVGMSVPAVDRLSKATQVAGGDLGTLTNAMFMLEKGIGEGSDKVAEGLGRIGLSFDELKQAGPDQYLPLIAQHFSELQDPSARAAAAMEIFGRQGRDLLPTLDKLNTGLQLTSDITPWTDQQSKDAEAFEMQLESMKVHAEAFGTSIGRWMIGPLSDFIAVAKPVTGWVVEFIGYGTGIIPIINTIGTAWSYAATAIGMFRGETAQLPAVTGPAQKGVEDWRKSVEDTALKVPTLTDALDTQKASLGGLKSAYDESLAANKLLQQQHDEYLKSVTNLSEAERGYQGVLDDLGDSVVNAITYELQHKASVEDITRVYGVDKEQVEILKTSLDAYGQLLKDVRNIEDSKNANSLNNLLHLNDAQAKANQSLMTTQVKAINDLDRDWTDYYDTQAQEGMTTADKQIAAVQKWYDDKVLKASAAGLVDQGYYNGLSDLAQRKMADITRQNDPFYIAHKTLLDNMKKDDDKFFTDLYGGWTTNFADTLIQTGSFKDAFHGVFDLLKQDVEKIFADMLANIIQGFFAPLEARLGGFLAKLAGIGGSGGSSGSGGGIWGTILGGVLGGGGGGGTPAWQGPVDGDPGESGTNPALPSPGVGLDPSPFFDPIGQPGNGGTPFANEGFDIARPTRAIVGDAPEPESVLRASTVRDIVRAARSSASPSGSAGLADVANRLDALHASLLDQMQQFNTTMLRLPRLLTEAQQLSGTR